MKHLTNTNTTAVKVYYNLNKQCLSILHKTEKGWRLKEHRKSIKLKNVKFVVYEAGRQRVIREHRKNVHAFIIGTEYKHSVFPPSKFTGQIVKYNPYYTSQFMTGGFHPIFEAPYCYIRGREVLV